MDELIKPVINRWAKPVEFDGEGKQISIVNFEELTLAEVTARDKRAPMYPPQDGIVRRLTFTQTGFDGERTLDMNSPQFQRDLAGRGIKIGSVGVLKRTKKETKGFKWSWTSITTP